METVWLKDSMAWFHQLVVPFIDGNCWVKGLDGMVSSAAALIVAGEEGGKEREKESKSGSSSPDPHMAASAVPMATLPASMTTVAASDTKPALAEDLEKKQGLWQ